VRVFSANVPGDGTLQYRLGAEARGRGWLDYVQGTTQALAGVAPSLRGFEVRIRSSVPLGSGLSSSASLSVALLRGLRTALGIDLDDVTLAQLAQRAENELVGAPVGIMDPMAANLAGERVALFLDTRSLAFERVPLPEEAELVVISSGVSHRHASGEYRVRRAECERAAALLGVRELRDVGEEDLPRLRALPEPIDRRARHVITENARVLRAVAAMRSGDLKGLGELLDASHSSLSHDFEVSTPEVDVLVAIAQREPNVFGARITGGGFGGSIVALVAAGCGAVAAARIAASYAAETGRTPAVLVPGVESAA
jgi:galactokinase